MAFHPYLFFAGNCRAFTRYQEVFGGELVLLAMKDMPSEEPVPDAQADLIMRVLSGATSSCSIRSQLAAGGRSVDAAHALKAVSRGEPFDRPSAILSVTMLVSRTEP